jgi:hypothetical protein
MYIFRPTQHERKKRAGIDDLPRVAFCPFVLRRSNENVSLRVLVVEVQST